MRPEGQTGTWCYRCWHAVKGGSEVRGAAACGSCRLAGERTLAIPKRALKVGAKCVGGQEEASRTRGEGM